MGKNKIRETEKGYIVSGGVCDYGILWRNKRRRGITTVFKCWFVLLGRNSSTKDTPYNSYDKGRGVKGDTKDICHLFPITDFTRNKIPILIWFYRGLNRRVNVEKMQTVWYFMKKDGKISKPRDYKTFFKTYLTRIKRERLGIKSEKRNPEIDMNM